MTASTTDQRAERYVRGGAGDGEVGVLRELWSYRELFYFLAWRDVKVRYKQTILGVLWALLHPLFTMLIFTVVFGRLAKVPTDDVPRPIFYFSALLPWTYFSSTITNAGLSLTSNAGLLTKIYFPRVILPAAPVLSGFLDFLIGSLLLVGFIGYYRIPLGVHLLLWPLLVLHLIALALGVGMFLAALNVKYRDIKYAIPFGIQLWLFVTPIIYPTSVIPGRFQWLLSLNPLTGLIEGFRAALVPSRPVPWSALGTSLAVTAVIFVVSVFYFRQTEKAFADIV